jgi:hypothetical protein
MLNSLGLSKKQLIFISFFVLLLGLLALNRIADFDVFYHLKTGEFILQNKTIPITDIFSFTASGHQWVNHYWLSDLIFFFVFQLFNSFWFLVIFVAMIAALAYFLVLKNTLKRGGDFYLMLALILPMAYLSMELWVPRPQIFSFLFFTLILFLLQKFRCSGDIKILFILPIIFLFWANLHASVIIGLVLLLIFIIAGISQNIIKKYNIFNLSQYLSENISSKLLLGIFITLVISTGICLINPNGFHIFTYLQEIKPTAQILGNAEWKSLLSFLGTIQAKIYLAMMILVSAFIFWRSFKRKNIDLYDWGLVVLSVALPLISIRHVIFFPLTIFPIFIMELTKTHYWQEYKKRWENENKEKVLYQILALILLTFSFIRVVSIPRSILNDKYLPVQAADFIQKENISGPMYNLEMGGYLIWRLWPEQKVFMDGRNEIYAGQPVEDYVKIARTEGGWDKVVDDYGINYFILWYREPLSGLAQKLDASIKLKDFRLVYWDDVALIFVKNNDKNSSIIDKYEYKVADPFYAPEQIKPWDFERARQDILRGLEINPNSQVLLDYGTILVDLFKAR